MSLSFVHCKDSFVPHSIVINTDLSVINIQSDEQKTKCKVKDSKQLETTQRDGRRG